MGKDLGLTLGKRFGQADVVTLKMEEEPGEGEGQKECIPDLSEFHPWAVCRATQLCNVPPYWLGKRYLPRLCEVHVIHTSLGMYAYLILFFVP